jgi:hypothetical protein
MLKFPREIREQLLVNFQLKERARQDIFMNLLQNYMEQNENKLQSLNLGEKIIDSEFLGMMNPMLRNAVYSKAKNNITEGALIGKEGQGESAKFEIEGRKFYVL